MYRIHFTPMPATDYSGRVRQLPGKWTHYGYVTPCSILVIMLDGACKFDFPRENQSICVGAKQAALIPAGKFYTGSCDVECEYYFFHFDNAVTEVDEAEARRAILEAERFQAERDPHHFFRHPPAVTDQMYMYAVTDLAPVMKSVVSMLAECDIEVTKRDVNRLLRLNIQLCRILAAVCEAAMSGLERRREYPATLERILSYVYEHYTERLTLEGLSQHFGLSKQHIIRLFRAHLGTTVTQFINDLKLSHAPELLCHSTLNVSEIAAYLGFSSPYYFSRLFREKYSVSPTKYSASRG